MTLLRRVVTAAVAVPAALFCLQSDAIFPLFVSGVAAAGVSEARGMMRPKPGVPAAPWLLSCIAAVCACAWLRANPLLIAVAVASSVVAVRVVLLLFYHWNDVDAGALGLLALDVLTFSAYVFPLCLGVLLRQLPGGLAVLVYCTVCVWNADNAALLFGKLCPSQCAWPMCPGISPSKTWFGAAGAVAGAAATSLAAVRVCAAFGVALPAELVASPATAGCCIGVLAVFGDLFESACKRAAGVKDSGSVFPGHGGILDRVDSSCFVYPAAFLCLVWLRGTHADSAL